MLKRKWKTYAVCFLLVLAGLWLSGREAQAAGAQMRPGQIYTVKVEGKNRSVKVTESRWGYSTANIALYFYLDGDSIGTVSGQDEFSSTDLFYTEIRKIPWKSRKTTLFYISVVGMDEASVINGIYEIRSGRLKKLLDGKKIASPSKRQNRFQVNKVSGKQVEIRCSWMANAIGCVDANVRYRYRKGKLVPSEGSKTCYPVSITRPGGGSTFTAAREIRLYKSAGGQKVSSVLYRGDCVKFVKCCKRKGRWYLYAKSSNGKRGWLKNTNEPAYPNRLFEEVIFAG